MVEQAKLELEKSIEQAPMLGQQKGPVLEGIEERNAFIKDVSSTS